MAFVLHGRMTAWVAVDTMSGDHGPEPAVHGAQQAIREYGSHVTLVGDPEKLEKLLKRFTCDPSHVQIAPAKEVITMDDSPARAVRSKPDASVVVAARLVKEKKAVGFFSPGNTGATMAAALLEMGRIKGVERPSIASPLPREDGGTTVLIDSGANVDCKASWLVQFAIMGEIYSREILGVVNPRVAVLSNGEEEGKGNSVSTDAWERLRHLPCNFMGNVEGRDLYGGGRTADVVVCDGFTGNIVLKATEGLATSIFTILLQGIAGSSLAKTGAYLLKPVLSEVKRRMDYTEYGGAPLLGVEGICIIGHGGSNATAFKNAIRVVDQSSKRDIRQKIEDRVRLFG
ncbi:MAG TPA: phosphate acyltransferase PlsX [Leptospiraceae bacterium]|nr:phosphate acyltransferase PlsX [Leptospiraceae bacterium]HMW62014.1 phosphate acyltransferase PlsX [Leptospiraceae bacterium]HMX57237.1 phosphate acyltransferase PlsX [Leptospiraceae bacterium]HMY44323.1 phosphate acyltransferase PlsX [Leptospiraceae bacterium]HNJ02899.1 phosphate acyltransferase PlsX [Leptospiraceae bacterium]